MKHVKSLLLLPWSMGFIPGFINPHLPNAYLKSTFEEVWDKEYELLDATSKHKFRCSQDVQSVHIPVLAIYDRKIQPDQYEETRRILLYWTAI